MQIVGSICEDGLGLISWWKSSGEETEEDEMAFDDECDVDGGLRQNLPNLTSLMAMGLIFVASIYMQGWRVNLTVKLQKARGMERPYPIKLFYTSNMPIILQTAFGSNIYFVSQMLYKSQPNSPFIKFIGEWATTFPESAAAAQYLVPVGGLAYYISPPATLSVLLHDPFHVLFYLAFTLTECAVSGRTWIEVSGTSVQDVMWHDSSVRIR
jgi:protein transport protein SEC61 subunit alpha